MKLTLNNNNQLVKFEDNSITTIGGYGFLHWNKTLISFRADKLTEVGYGFLYWNETLISFRADKLTEVRYDFLCWNKNKNKFMKKLK